MKLEGIHHVTAITGDAPANVDFYVGVLGLRMVKKTVNQDNPSIYHLFYGDDQGSPGADLTFFEYPGAMRGRAGTGMVHTIGWRVGSRETLDFWSRRFGDEGVEHERLGEDSLAFSDRDGLRHLLSVYGGDEPALTASAPDIPPEHALRGFDGVRAYASNPAASAGLLSETLGFARAARSGDDGDRDARDARDGGNDEGDDGTAAWTVGGELRSSYFVYDEPPDEPGVQGAGSVHHVAFATRLEEHDAWQRRVAEAGASPTPVIDRFWFRSIYFREPSGVLFELATIGPGFTTDEPLEELGQNLSLPPNFEHLRDQLTGTLTQLPDPRTIRAAHRV